MTMEAPAPDVMLPSPLLATRPLSVDAAWVEDGIDNRRTRLAAAETRLADWLNDAMARDRARREAHKGADDHWAAAAQARNSR